MEEKNVKVFEYTTKVTSKIQQTSTIDMYESFGWEHSDIINSINNSSISFKRDRKILHRQELNRLEKKAETIKKAINELEVHKTHNAKIFAIVWGIISCLIMGGGMSLTMLKPESQLYMTLGIIVGIVGIFLCVVNYFIYRHRCEKKTNKLNPLIEENEEKLAIVLEQAQSLLVTEAKI